jgi:hypothetical protein
VDRLNLDSYKATLKGLTQFGDRREGTQRNRDAVAWIEAQLKSYGCATERMTYEPPAPRGGGGGGNRGGGAAVRGRPGQVLVRRVLQAQRAVRGALVRAPQALLLVPALRVRAAAIGVVAPRRALRGRRQRC